MISCDELHKQLEKVGFNPNGWGRTEVNELCNILTPDEEVEALVNGWYEAGFALLVATKHRVLLVDKKPLNYLTVEDIRFDMISEFDYSHRLIGAHVSISSGYKTLSFTSLNQRRLRNLLTYVQDRMTEMNITKHTQRETQRQHLEDMNEQLRQYLINANQQLQGQIPKTASPDATTAETHTPEEVTAEYGKLPQPIFVPTQTISSPSSFEQAAAVSMGADGSQADSEPTQAAGNQQPIAEGAGVSVLRKVVLTPQQVGLAAMRRVVPIITAYSKRPFPPNRAEEAQSTAAPGSA